jgi:hypothetical protein
MPSDPPLPARFEIGVAGRHPLRLKDSTFAAEKDFVKQINKNDLRRQSFQCRIYKEMDYEKIMRRVVRLHVDEIIPTAQEVLENQGMAGRPNLPARITALLDSALDLFKRLAEPKGIMEDFAIPDFPAIYDGNGLNSSEGPVPMIVPGAEALALFAATMGDTLMAKSSELFTTGGPALGYMLDAVNTSGAEHLGQQMARRFMELLPEEKRRSKDLKAQYYCPGHCGWHISGQDKLFQTLHPEEIGITLKQSWAMHPLKSISGILVVGGIEIHRFLPNFSFCKQCKEHKCVQRLKILESSI